MKHSAYIVCCENVHPNHLVWREPIAWDCKGKVTHYSTHPAFISKTKITGGYRYAVRKCTLRISPPELPS